MYGWDWPVLTFIYPGFDCAAFEFNQKNIEVVTMESHFELDQTQYAYQSHKYYLCFQPRPLHARVVAFPLRAVFLGSEKSLLR